MNALRIELELSQAHFRKPWSFSIRHTYPVPPFSTVIGFLCNVLGDKGLLFQNDFGLAVFSRFESLDCEYTWLRNLSPKAHKAKYHSYSNRQLRDNNIEHPGGQSPVRIFVLNDVKLLLYLNCENENLYSLIQEGFKRPGQWFSHLHLGRSEDWVVVKSAEVVKLEKKSYSGKTEYMTWIPSPEEYLNAGKTDGYERTFHTLKGRTMLIPAKYEIVSVNNTRLRNFEWKKVKVLESQNYPITLTSESFEYLIDSIWESDKVTELPVIFTRIDKFEEGDELGS